MLLFAFLLMASLLPAILTSASTIWPDMFLFHLLDPPSL